MVDGEMTAGQGKTLWQMWELHGVLPYTPLAGRAGLSGVYRI